MRNNGLRNSGASAAAGSPEWKKDRNWKDNDRHFGFQFARPALLSVCIRPGRWPDYFDRLTDYTQPVNTENPIKGPFDLGL